MAVQCPYCEHSLALKGVKPGKYTTKCPKCDRKFVLAIPADADLPPLVKPLPAERATLARRRHPAWSRDPDRWRWELPRSADDVTSDFSGPSADIHKATAPAPPTEAGRVAGRDGSRSGRCPARRRRWSGRRHLRCWGAIRSSRNSDAAGWARFTWRRQLSLNRSVALKVMRPEWARNATFVARFTREAYAAAQLSHHNIVQIFDFGEDKGTDLLQYGVHRRPDARRAPQAEETRSIPKRPSGTYSKPRAA